MIIYFLRHANAGPKHFSNAAKDEKRPIDKVGEEQSHDVGHAMAAMGVAVNAIISSPLTRAMQTILAAEGETVINYDTARDTKQLGIVFNGEVAWSGVRSGGN